MLSQGIESKFPIKVMRDMSTVSKKDEFLRLFSRKTITELKNHAENGVFIVCAYIDGLTEGDYSYLACKCYRKSLRGFGDYYCSGCDRHFFIPVPKY